MVAEQLRQPAEIGMSANYHETAAIMCMADTLNFAVFVTRDGLSPFDMISVSSASIESPEKARK